MLSGLGAATAVILLIFKDTILGLVAGIQLVANDMVRPGDWIEMPKYGADGDVLEVALTTVKIQNFDRTISTVPTINLLAHLRFLQELERDGGVGRQTNQASFAHRRQFCPVLVSRTDRGIEEDRPTTAVH